MPKLLEQLSPEFALYQHHEIPVLHITHPECQAQISLQGAQLISWQPSSQAEDVLWLSEIEPFQAGNAIRGGIPICYPWFGGVKSPSHGTARIQLWHLSHFSSDENNARVEFSLYQHNHILDAKISMKLGKSAKLTFTHYGQTPAQLALHSYFHVSHIEQAELQGLPTLCFDQLSQQAQRVNSPRKINENVDCIYPATNDATIIQDSGSARDIMIEHRNASDVVVWNPWHKATSSMSQTGYQTMLCVESARIQRCLQQGEQLSVKIAVQSA